MGKFLLLITLLNYTFSFSQPGKNKSANQWYFPKFAGLEFNRDTTEFLSGGQSGNSESSAVICDSNGQMQFYSDGIKIWNRFHREVKNSNDIGFGFGGTINTSGQGAILLKHPDNDSLLFLFCSDYQGRSGGLTYSVIRIHGNNDSGEVILKKIKLSNEINEPLTAVNHQNGRDIWITCHGFKSDYFYSFLLTKNGVVKCPVLTQIGVVHFSSFGGGSGAQVGMKFSPNGQYIVTEQYLEWRNEVFRFNAEKGKFYDTVYSKDVDLCPFTSFSPDNRLLYFCYIDTGLVQMDISTGKRMLLHKFSLLNNQTLGEIQLGPDGKIYGIIDKSRDIFVINNPNVEGIGCNITVKKNFLSGGGGGEQALPNFNQSLFYTPSVDFNYEVNCTNNLATLEGSDTIMATSYFWKIYTSANTLEASYTTKNISHDFKTIGVYKIIFIADNGSQSDTVTKSLTIYPAIPENFLGRDTIYSQDASINKTLQAPAGMHCITWQDGSGSDIFNGDTTGIYICTVVRQDFCQVTDTIIISECINNLIIPSFYRSRDTLFVNQPLADSFVWFRNEQVYRITKENYLKLSDTGHYRVEAAKKGHCNRSSTVNWVNKLDINSISLSDLSIRLYPNPSLGTIFIFSNNNFELTICDVTGRVIQSVANADRITLQSGVYVFIFKVNGYQITENMIVY